MSARPATRAALSPRLDAPCRECGAQAFSTFCTRRCRATFNNRRATRGAEVYDLLMALRFQRQAASELRVWTLICRLLAIWRAEDEARRAGRRSWRDPAIVISERPWLHAITVRRGARP